MSLGSHQQDLDQLFNGNQYTPWEEQDDILSSLKDKDEIFSPVKDMNV